MHWDLAPENPARLARAGIPIAFTTNGLEGSGGYLAAVRKAISRGLSKEAALKALTVTPAELFGVAGELGTIEPGKIADLIVLDADPLQNIRNTSRIHRVMKDGRLYDGATLAEIYPRQREVQGMYWLDSYTPSADAGIR